MADLEQPVPGAIEPQAAPKKDNLMELLRTKREEASRNVLLELPVPGYDDLLVVRFQKTLTWLEAKKFIDTSQRKGNPLNEVFAIADLLIRTVEGVYGRADPEGELVLISSGFDETLAAYFELDTKTARETTRLFFQSDLVMAAVQARVIQWLQGLDEASGTEIRGN